MGNGVRRIFGFLAARWRGYLLQGLGIAAVFWGVSIWQTRGVAEQFPAQAMLEVQAPDGQVQPMTLAQWRKEFGQRPVALHVWADWCPICKLEHDSVSRVASDWPVLTVAMKSGDAAQVGRFLRAKDLNWTAVVDANGELARALGVGAVPAWLVVDAQGQIRTPAVGYTTEWGMRLRLWWVNWLG
jgi:thiol:disulfide interchange protein